jgi:hypothetical protein
MARTLFIIDDSIFKNLGSTITTKMIDEVKSIFSFDPKFTVSSIAAPNLPEKIDFTDSIVKIVAKDDEITAAQNQAQQQQLQSIEFAIRQRNVNVQPTQFRRSAAKPETGGVGWQFKVVLAAGGQQLALVQTGGIASCEFTVDAVLTFQAPDHWTLDEARGRYQQRLQAAERQPNKEEREKEPEKRMQVLKNQRRIGIYETRLLRTGRTIINLRWASH